MADGQVTLSIVVTAPMLDDIEQILGWLECEYNTHRRLGSPEWEVMRPRAKRYLTHLFRVIEDGA